MAKNGQKGPQLVVAAIFTTIIVGGAAATGSYFWANNNAYAAKVNGETISTKEYIEFVDRAKKQYAGQIGADFNSEAGQNMLKTLKKNIMDSLVDMSVMKQAAKDKNLTVDAEEKETKFKELIKSRYQGNEEAFKEALEQNKVTRAEFDEQFADQLLLQKLFNDIVKDVKATDEDIKKFYEENIARFKTPEQLNAQHILIKADPENEAEVNKAKAEAEKLIAQIKGGADFGKLAEKHSQDEGSKVKGGDLGGFSKGQMVLPFEEALLKLDKGEVTASPVKTRFGWHIIKRGETTPETTRKLEEVKPLISSNLQQKQQQEAFEAWLKKEKEKANIKVNESLLEVKAPPKKEEKAETPAEGATSEKAPGNAAPDTTEKASATEKSDASHGGDHEGDHKEGADGH